MWAKLFFLYCAAMIVGTAFLAITRKNPVHALLMVLVLFVHQAALYLLLGAEFLAAVQVIVYAGAVLVLYLFVLFLVDLRKEVQENGMVGSAVVGRVVAAGIGSLFLAASPGFLPNSQDAVKITGSAVSHTKAIGFELFSTCLLPFELAGLILLVAVVGGLVLAKRREICVKIKLIQQS